MTLPRRAFVAIRHGETDANRAGLIAGRTEAMLTEAGRAAAARLAQWSWPADLALFASPQRRARDTAALAFPRRSARILPGLRERDWGCHEGAPVSTLPPRHACPEGGEPYEEMLARVTTATCLALESAGDRLPVLVAHSGVIRILRLLSGGSDGGPSAPNATPILFTPAATGWHERVLDKTMR
ncbi:histidine phosphatase family protein [Paenirhodobacter enshiensis]|uniref:Phosphoglycerate mutase n=1 Tax=Paenirhodobacter enshiensis TaxID=1105367 RepID=A0A086XSQ4_9RHOB|nr:histidine phosphatase family protein [Paenirhodobacter enshiensis]KFI25054.1 hypothetical protein CG50_07110 [Paenirhodobacter enshiensis]